MSIAFRLPLVSQTPSVYVDVSAVAIPAFRRGPSFLTETAAISAVTGSGGRSVSESLASVRDPSTVLDSYPGIYAVTGVSHLVSRSLGFPAHHVATVAGNCGPSRGSLIAISGKVGASGRVLTILLSPFNSFTDALALKVATVPAIPPKQASGVFLTLFRAFDCGDAFSAAVELFIIFLVEMQTALSVYRSHATSDGPSPHAVFVDGSPSIGSDEGLGSTATKG